MLTAGVVVDIVGVTYFGCTITLVGGSVVVTGRSRLELPRSDCTTMNCGRYIGVAGVVDGGGAGNRSESGVFMTIGVYRMIVGSFSIVIICGAVGGGMEGDEACTTSFTGFKFVM